MKISKETINVLKNFATISNNLRIYPGNVLATISPQPNIFAKVTVPDTFPVDACIYNLNSFLELMSFYDDQEVEFSDKSLAISRGGEKFEFTYADPSVIIAPPAGKSIAVTAHYEFTLTASDIAQIKKAIGITAAEQIKIEAKNGKATLVVGDKTNSMKHSKVIGDCDKTFTALLDSQNLVVIPENYTVTLDAQKFLHFKGENTTVPEYWLALDPKSVV